MNPLVSIILPVFNGQEYIRKAIDSVISQSYNNWELLVINDGSTDCTPDIIKSINNRCIKSFNQDNLGVAAARNYGLREMRGDFFCFLDADDLLTKNSIEVRLKMFLDQPALSFVDGAVEIWNSNFTSIKRIWRPNFSGNPLKSLCRLDGNCFFGPTWLVRREPQTIYHFKNGLTHGEDLLFYISISNDLKYNYVEDSIYQYRSGNLSAMSNLDGLANGYNQIYKELINSQEIDTSLLNSFRRRSRLVMLKSYLADGKLIKGLSYYFNPSLISVM